MPFVQIDVDKKIEKLRNTDEEFKKEWDNSREEYRLIGEMVALRKKRRITQKELAEIMGNKQQVISRIEKHEQCPTLRFFCRILNVLGYELKIVKKQRR